jgi:putative ABC transport system permease protein
VKNAARGEWTESPDDEMYLPYLQSHEYLEKPEPHFEYLTIVIRTTGDPAALAPVIRGMVASADKNVLVSDVQTMDQVVADATAEPRFYALVIGVFAAVALLLAAVGIYGVMSYSVSRRTQEIGIRMALGAKPDDVIKSVVKQGALLAAAGVGTGLIGALALTRLMARLLYGVRPSDPVTFAVVAILLSTVAVFASYIPARRAAKVDPMVALRYE